MKRVAVGMVFFFSFFSSSLFAALAEHPASPSLEQKLKRLLSSFEDWHSSDQDMLDSVIAEQYKLEILYTQAKKWILDPQQRWHNEDYAHGCYHLIALVKAGHYKKEALEILQEIESSPTNETLRIWKIIYLTRYFLKTRLISRTSTQLIPLIHKGLKSDEHALQRQAMCLLETCFELGFDRKSIYQTILTTLHNKETKRDARKKAEELLILLKKATSVCSRLDWYLSR